MTSETTELDKTRRYLVPVGRLELPGQPDVVHLTVYRWIPRVQEWFAGQALCGYSTEGDPLPAGTEVTCQSCEAYRAKYQTVLDLQAGLDRQPVSEMVAQDRLVEQVRAAVRASGLKQRWIAGRLNVSDKHLSQLLTGRVPMTLDWAERILALCGMELVVAVRPKAGGVL